MQFVDIHCHLLPGIDDGAGDLATSLAMAQMASQDGTGVIICTPHQLGNYECNSGNSIRDLVAATQAEIDAARLPLKLMPGADVRIESGMMQGLRSGDVLTLGDLGKHVLLELPHELYFPIGEVLQKLSQMGMQGILSHPERNAGLLARPALVAELVQQGCLMQVTAGSLVGSMGPASKRMAESLLLDGLVHFLATDAHGTKSRRPLMRRAFERSAELVGESTAELICCTNPGLVALGQPITAGVVGAAAKPRKNRSGFRGLSSTSQHLGKHVRARHVAFRSSGSAFDSTSKRIGLRCCVDCRAPVAGASMGRVASSNQLRNVPGSC